MYAKIMLGKTLGIGVYSYVMARDNDRLKKYIEWAIECYEVAASPPALNYAKRVDTSYRDDVNGYSRAYLLRLAIDAKYALNNLLANLPIRRANILLAWLISTEAHYYHSLTYKQQTFLNRDRKTLKNRLQGKKTPSRTMQNDESLMIKTLNCKG